MHHYSPAEILVAAIVMIAAATDVRSRRIPNWLTLFGVCAGLALNWAVSGTDGLKTSSTGMALGFGAYFALYCLRAMGAGDVKLMAAVGAVVGPRHWVAVFIATAAAGGLLSLALVAWKGRVKETLWNAFFITNELVHLRAPRDRRADLDVKDSRALNMPHGLAIAAGTVTCLILAII